MWSGITGLRPAPPIQKRARAARASRRATTAAAPRSSLGRGRSLDRLRAARLRLLITAPSAPEAVVIGNGVAAVLCPPPRQPQSR